MVTAIIVRETGRALVQIEREIERDPHLKSVHSRRGYLGDLTRFEEWRGGRPMSKLLAQEYLSELQREGKSPNTINRSASTIRWWARRLADLAFEDSTLAREEREEIISQASRVATIENVGGGRLQKARRISEGEFKALLLACGSDPAGIRDGAIFSVAWQTGMRRAELSSLALADYRPTGEREADLVIRGKGDKERLGYVWGGGADAVADWLSVRGDEAGPLFLAINKAGKAQDHGLSGQALALMLARRLARAGIAHVSWHGFRRSFVGSLLENNTDLPTVQRLCGHESPITTSAYDPRGPETQKRAVRTLHVPYRRKMLRGLEEER